MKIVIDLETDYYGWVSGSKVFKEDGLRKEYPDLDLLWVKYSKLAYELKTLKEMNERCVDTLEVISIFLEICDVEKETAKAKEEYELLLKLLWGNEDGINL